MQQYEYTSFSINKAGFVQEHGDLACTHLDTFGKEGWELVATTFVPETSSHGQIDAFRSRVMYHMKRPLQSSTPFR